MRRMVLALSLVPLVACGRTGLKLDEGVDAGPPDAGPPIEPCPDDVPPGSIRWQIEGVITGAAFGPRGHVYATVADGLAIDLASFDRCTGAMRWRSPAVPAADRRGLVREPRVRFTTEDDVLVVLSQGYVAAYGVWRFGLDGTPRAPYAIPDSMVDFYAVPAGRGPVVRTYREPDSSAAVLALSGELEAAWVGGPTPAEECVADGQRLQCYGGGYRLASGAEVWSSDRAEIVDGTFRHVVPPAVDGDRLYAIVYGISSYWLDAISTRDGSRVFRTSLMRTTRGQSDLRLGRPIVDADGTIYVYAYGHREDGPDGALHAFDRDGEERWRYAQRASMEAFFHHGTHVLGDAGLVYLAIGDAISAVETRDGSERWTLRPGVAVNTPQIAMGPTGDLAVQTDDDQLLVIATESSGLADAPWPAPGGDRRNGDAR